MRIRSRWIGDIRGKAPKIEEQAPKKSQITDGESSSKPD
jgi:hypothetical protein